MASENGIKFSISKDWIVEVCHFNVSSINRFSANWPSVSNLNDQWALFTDIIKYVKRIIIELIAAPAGFPSVPP